MIPTDIGKESDKEIYVTRPKETPVELPEPATTPAEPVEVPSK